MEEKVLTKEEKEKLRKERQKRRKYRLLILLLLMLGTGTMLATSTYAWFTSNKNVSVETLKVNIEAKNGIQISADGTKWKSIVQKADLVGAHPGNYKTAVNQIPEALEPVSTIAVPDDNGYLPMYYGVVETSETVANNGEYIITATKTTEIDNAVRTEGDTKEFDQRVDTNADYVKLQETFKDILSDDSKKIYVPLVVTIKDGAIVNHHYGTLDEHDATERDLNEDEIKQLIEVYTDMLKDFK